MDAPYPLAMTVASSSVRVVAFDPSPRCVRHCATDARTGVAIIHDAIRRDR